MLCSKVIVSLLNSIAPSVTSSAFQECSPTALAMLTVGGWPRGNIGLILCPMFSYKRGHVFQEETNLLSKLCNSGLSCDKSFSLLFRNKVDSREARFVSCVGAVTCYTIWHVS